MWYNEAIIMDSTDSNRDKSNDREVLARLIISLWDAASEYSMTGSSHATSALRAALNAVNSAIDEVTELQVTDSNAEMMIHYKVDISRLMAARDRVQNEDTLVSLNVRVPEFLNEYIRRFHGRANERRKLNRQSELTRQQIVSEALALFLAVHSLPDPVPEPEW